MKSRAAKMITALVLVALTLVSVVLPASAEVYSPYIYSTSAATAGTYKTESTRYLTSKTLATIYGGDVGIWFYSGNVGLQASFYPTTSRTTTMQCWAKRSSGSDVLARTYKGYFETVDGVYLNNLYQEYSTYGSLLSSSSTVGLYMRFIISTHSKDTSKSIPAGALHYRFWAF